MLYGCPGLKIWLSRCRETHSFGASCSKNHLVIFYLRFSGKEMQTWPCPLVIHIAITISVKTMAWSDFLLHIVQPLKSKIVFKILFELHHKSPNSPNRRLSIVQHRGKILPRTTCNKSLDQPGIEPSTHFLRALAPMRFVPSHSAIMFPL